MPSSAGARGGPVRPSFTQPALGSKRSASTGATRLAMKEESKEVIVVASDESGGYDDASDYDDPSYVESGGSDIDDDDDDGGGENGEPATSLRSGVTAGRPRCITQASTDGLPTSHQHTHPLSNRPIHKTLTKTTYGRPPGRISALVRNTDTWSALGPCSSLNGPHSSGKTDVLVPRRDGPSIKDANTSGSHLLHTPSTVALPSSPHGNQSSKSRSSRQVGVAIPGKVDTNIGTSRRKPNTTPAPATPFAIANSNSTSPGFSSSPLPPTFQPAVKPRIYSASQPSGKRNVNVGPQRLEAFGFVSGASLMPATTKRNPNTVPPVSNIRDAVSAATLTSILEPEPVRKPISKPIKQEEVHILGSSRGLISRATRNIAATAKSSPISKLTSKPMKQEAPEINTTILQPLPQTPKRPRSTKRVRTPSYSTGTYRDPYAISSDSESSNDDDNNRNFKPHSCPPLKSFAESSDTHETASDVEAVLNQFPAWLDSPNPAELRSSYLGASRPSSSSRPGKRLRGDGVVNRGRVGRENRPTRFGDGGGFSTSPIPGDRVTSLGRITSCEDAITAPKSILPTRGILSPSALTRTSSPTRRVTPTKRVSFVEKETPPTTEQNTFPRHRLTPGQQTVVLDKCTLPLAGQNTPQVEITILDSDLDADSDINGCSNEDLNSKEDMDSNANLNPHHEHHDNPIQGQESVVRGGATKKAKKRKKKRSRHRERDRKIWRLGGLGGG
ncbi:hypothetical protein F4803DRAFT_556091 [Xylaria telfairii]|nr:hypothetical protein F4803DRAFT_556091 [Xylaria telfairii]